jgi:hypothetical protein
MYLIIPTMIATPKTRIHLYQILHLCEGPSLRRLRVMINFNHGPYDRFSVFSPMVLTRASSGGLPNLMKAATLCVLPLLHMKILVCRAHKYANTCDSDIRLVDLYDDYVTKFVKISSQPGEIDYSCPACAPLREILRRKRSM